MGNRPSSVHPSHWTIFEKTQKIKDPVALAKVTQSILTKPELVLIAKKYGVLDWLQASAAYRSPGPDRRPSEMTGHPASLDRRLPEVAGHLAGPDRRLPEVAGHLAGPDRRQAVNSALAAIVVHPTAEHGTDPRLVAFENEEKRREREFQEESKRRREDFLRQIAGMGDGQAYAVLGIRPDASYDEAKNAYKRLAIVHHPDKGGSEEAFDRITKAFAYVVEQLKSRAGAAAQFDTLRSQAQATAPEPGEKRVAFGLIDPKKFDNNLFNKIFEATKVQEEEDEGYDTWLRGEDEELSKMPVFSGSYNRDVFNRMFAEHAATRIKTSDALAISHGPEEIQTTDRIGHSTLGGGKPREFTAASGANLQYTDLRAAYEQHNIITTHDPRAEARQSRKTLNAYEVERASTMGPLTAEEKEIEMRREHAEQMRESDRQKRLRERDEKHAFLYDRMMTTQYLPGDISARMPALPAPIHPRLPTPPDQLYLHDK